MADQNLGGGNPGSEGTPGAGGNTGGTPAHAPGGGQQPVAGAPAAGTPGGQPAGEKTYTYKEDRTDWVPRHRLNETGTKLTAAEQRALAAEQALEQERKRVRALSGVEPQDPRAKETEEVKAALLQVFPHLKMLETIKPEDLQRVLQAADTAQSATQAQWTRHAESMFTDLETDVAKQLGIEKLSDSQKRRIRIAYREEAAAAAEARERAQRMGEHYDAANDFLARHERGDRTLLKEFAQSYLADWFEPARRSVTAAEARRNLRPVPRGERTRQIPASGQPTVDLNTKEGFQKALLAARGGGQE